jgi:protein TonB
MQAPAVVNGVSPYRSPPTGRARGGESLRRVLGIGHDAWLVLTVTLGVALLFHVGAGVRAWLIPLELIDWNHRVGFEVADRLNETYEIEQEKLKPPEPPPPPPEPEKTVERVVAPDQTPPPPPMAAQAGQILAAPDKDDEPVDLTNAFVVGTGDGFAGGVTQAGGTSKNAVYGLGAAATGVPGGTGTKPVPQLQAAGPDRSRGIQLAGSAEWRCPFPPEADVDQVDDAYVTIQVTVGGNGKASRVNVVQDPGHGFGREARACGLRETYLPALDRDGNPVDATKSFRIHFER